MDRLTPVPGQRVGGRGRRDIQILVADLAPKAAENLIPAAKRRGQDLAAETDPQHRDPACGRILDQLMLTMDEGDILIGAVRATRQEDSVIPVKITRKLIVP